MKLRKMIAMVAAATILSVPMSAYASVGPVDYLIMWDAHDDGEQWFRWTDTGAGFSINIQNRDYLLVQENQLISATDAAEYLWAADADAENGVWASITQYSKNPAGVADEVEFSDAKYMSIKYYGDNAGAIRVSVWEYGEDGEDVLLGYQLVSAELIAELRANEILGAPLNVDVIGDLLEIQELAADDVVAVSELPIELAEDGNGYIMSHGTLWRTLSIDGVTFESDDPAAYSFDRPSSGFVNLLVEGYLEAYTGNVYQVTENGYENFNPGDYFGRVPAAE